MNFTQTFPMYMQTDIQLKALSVLQIHDLFISIKNIKELGTVSVSGVDVLNEQTYD